MKKNEEKDKIKHDTQKDGRTEKKKWNYRKI